MESRRNRLFPDNAGESVHDLAKVSARREARLTRICDLLLWAMQFFMWGLPLGAIAGNMLLGWDEFWVVICLLLGTFLAWIAGAVHEVFDGRREEEREAVVFEEAKSDAQPFCLMLRSFTDPVLGYGLYFTQLGDKGQRQYEGPVHFRSLADGIAGFGRLLVLCRESHEDAVLRSREFEHIGLRAPDERWVEFFRFAASRCRAIVVVPGSSPGLLDEVRIVRSEPSLLRKAMVFMPHTPPERVGGTYFLDAGSIAAAWERIRSDWSKAGFALPEYRSGGSLYSPNADFSVDTTRRDSLSGSVTLSELLAARIPLEGELSSTAEVLRAADEYGVTLLKTAAAGRRERRDIAWTMVVVALVSTVVWFIHC